MSLGKWLEGPCPMPKHERVFVCAAFILGLLIGGAL